MQKCKIGIIGFGTVGKGIYKILKSKNDLHPILKDIEIVGIAVKNINKKRDIKLENNLLISDPYELIKDPNVDVIVEVMGGTDIARDIILKSLKARKSVVTANKAVIARYGNEIYSTAAKNGVYVLTEAAVCGGIPIIEPLKRSLKSNQINKMVGIINGTTNFILTKMSNEKADYVKSLGADEIVRYDQVDLKETVKELTDGKGVDIVIDPVGGEATEQALRATAFNGRLLVIGFANGSIPKISLNLTLVKGVSIVGVWWGRWTNTAPTETAEDFQELISFIENDKLKIVPKNNYKLEETSVALENFLTRKNIGKTVISI